MYAKRCCVQNWPVDRPWKEILGNAHTTENFLCVEGCRSLFSLAWFERWSLRLTSVFAAYFSSLAHFLEHYLTALLFDCSQESLHLRSLLFWLRTLSKVNALELLSWKNFHTLMFPFSRLTSAFTEKREKSQPIFPYPKIFCQNEKNQIKR